MTLASAARDGNARSPRRKRAQPAFHLLLSFEIISSWDLNCWYKISLRNDKSPSWLCRAREGLHRQTNYDYESLSQSSEDITKNKILWAVRFSVARSGRKCKCISITTNDVLCLSHILTWIFGYGSWSSFCHTYRIQCTGAEMNIK